MTALENVQVGMHSRLRTRVTGMLLRTPFNRREERDVARAGRRAAASSSGSSAHDELAMNLPYGDQRRLEIARALASEPKLLLLDEPTAGMNPQESEELRQLMERLRTERGMSVLLIEHDMRVVMNVSDHITVLDHGEKIAEGSPRRSARTRGSSRRTSGARHERRDRADRVGRAARPRRASRCCTSTTSTRSTARSRR